MDSFSAHQVSSYFIKKLSDDMEAGRQTVC